MKQHFIPQVYLKEFLNKNRKLYTLDTALLKFGRKVFSEERSTAEVCRSKDFYILKPHVLSTFHHMKNLHALSIEESFHRYERAYPKIIAKIKSRQQAIPMEDARTLIYMLVDFKTRNMHFREDEVPRAYVAAVEEIIGKYKGLQYADLPMVLNLSRKDILKQVDLIAEKFTGISSPEDMHLSTIAFREQDTESIHRKIVDHVLNFDWVMFESDGGFATNDNPGVSMDSKNRIWNTKFDEGFKYFCPLTTSLCLSIDANKPDTRYEKNKVQKYINYQKCSPRLAEKINLLAVYHINRHIFSGSKAVIDSVAANINRSATVRGEI